MATLFRTVRTLVVAAAVLAVLAPVAQARPLQAPAGPPQASTPPTHAVAPTTSGAGLDWTDAAIGAAVMIVVIGVGVSGARLSHRRTAQA